MPERAISERPMIEIRNVTRSYGTFKALDDAQLDLRSARIDQVMTRHPRTIGAEMLAVEAAHVMEQHKINGLLVVDAEGRVVGALNIHDLLRARVV